MDKKQTAAMMGVGFILSQMIATPVSAITKGLYFGVGVLLGTVVTSYGTEIYLIITKL